MRRYRLPILAAALLLVGLALYSAPMLGLAPASAARTTYVNAETWQQAGARIAPYLVQAGFKKVPEEMALLAFKDSKRLELWARGDRQWRYVRAYPILAASGLAGPKLRDGDRQVPEGVYRIALLNPNASYYLAMKLDYPNAYDRAQAQADNRTNLGGNICLHGWEVSSGSLAVGNVAIEELYLLASKVGEEHVRIVIAPNDLRTERPLSQGGPAVAWLNDLYSRLALELRPFHFAQPAPGNASTNTGTAANAGSANNTAAYALPR
jgi:hypothetical protein